jgi:hypothetical protein
MSSSSSYNKIPADVSRVAAHGSSETAGTRPGTAVTSEVVGTPAGNRPSQLSSEVVGTRSVTGVATQVVGTPPGNRLDSVPADVADVARVTKEGLMAMCYEVLIDFETRLQEIRSLRSAGSPLLSLSQSTAIPTEAFDIVGDVMMATFSSMAFRC